MDGGLSAGASGLSSRDREINLNFKNATRATLESDVPDGDHRLDPPCCHSTHQRATNLLPLGTWGFATEYLVIRVMRLVVFLDRTAHRISADQRTPKKRLLALVQRAGGLREIPNQFPRGMYAKSHAGRRSKHRRIVPPSKSGQPSPPKAALARAVLCKHRPHRVPVEVGPVLLR